MYMYIFLNLFYALDTYKLQRGTLKEHAVAAYRRLKLELLILIQINKVSIVGAAAHSTYLLVFIQSANCIWYIQIDMLTGQQGTLVECIIVL